MRVCAVTFIQIIPNLTGDKSTSAYPFYGFHLLFFQQRLNRRRIFPLHCNLYLI
ncbi:hypothetical protein CSC04_3912 [Enterobacter roggenkampii]|nr:hypothetical protein CSC04_3912 [Enterobacter roggenkampii]